MDTSKDTGADTQNVSENGAKCRWNAKSWLLTYSQSKLSKEELQSHLSSMKEIEKLAVGHEHHQDGNSHFHCVVVFKSKVDSRNPKYWDLKGEHPNVKSLKRGPKNFLNAVSYVTKEDPEPLIVGFDLDELQSLRPGEYGRMIQAIKDGADLPSIRENFLGSYLRYKRNVRETVLELRQDALKKQCLPWKGIKSNIPEIQEWVNTRVRKPRYPLPQLWITGPPGIGKSSLISFLKKYLTTYPVPTDKWMCGFEDDQFDLLYIDEFQCKNYPLTKLNKVADGMNHNFETKGGQTQMTKPVPMIILSNYSLSSSYSRLRSECVGDFPLDRRFTEVYIPDGVLISVEEDTEVVE